jgi:Na+-translocating ferredoxin:NAD+ oxidoreductase RnfA subunit
MFIFSGFRERLDEKSIPEGFRGNPIALITAAALAVIFARLGGIILWIFLFQ